MLDTYQRELIMFDPDSMASYYFEQGLEAYLSGEEEPEESVGVSCKYCHRDGFAWGQFPRGWRLYSLETGHVHSCQRYKPEGEWESW